MSQIGKESMWNIGGIILTGRRNKHLEKFRFHYNFVRYKYKEAELESTPEI